MNRSVLQSSAVQQLMAGNPNWWNNINNMRPPVQPPSHPLLPPSSFIPQYAPPFSSVPPTSCHDNQELPESWSQLLLGGLNGEEDRADLNQLQSKRLDNWEDQVLFLSPSNVPPVDVKQEASESEYPYIHRNEELKARGSTWWSHQLMPASPPRSCITSFSSNMLDFSNNKGDERHHQPDHSSECNSTATGGAFKKARVQPSSSQSTFKVRKEKLGDRITALHQLVSPFGKTDTASVLLEAIGYIRFLQGQIEALSSPYLDSKSGNMRKQISVQGERNCIFPEDPGQLLNDPCMKGRGAPEQNGENEAKKDLRSRGLCLVPVSCTLHVGSDNGADYWAPTFGGCGGFR